MTQSPHNPAKARDEHHHDPHDMTRRKFLGTLTGALAAGIVVQIFGCTEAEHAAGPAAPACPDGHALGKTAASLDRTGAVSANHGHAATVTGAVQDAGIAHTLNIQGTSDHNHTVSLTTTDIYNLRTGAAVSKTSSSTGGHTHTVTFAMITSSTPTKTGEVGDNHGHAATVTGVLQDSNAAIALQIQGGADHNHLVHLTAQDLADIKAGTLVSKATSLDATGHSHTVIFAGVTAIRPAC
jgi:hypothetical protein